MLLLFYTIWQPLHQLRLAKGGPYRSVPALLNNVGTYVRFFYSRSIAEAKLGTSEQYTASIVYYAKQRHFSLYAGVHFSRLAETLRKPFDHSAKRSPTYNYKYAADFATLYKYAKETPVEYHTLGVPVELVQHAKSESNNILFLRGQPCPQWLVQAGISYHIDPEFFFRHLDFLSHMSSKQYFAQPLLMSTSRNIIQLKYMTIAEFPPQLSDLDQHGLDELRGAAMRDMAEYFNNLGKKVARNTSAAESIVRGYHVLDNNHFVIEQQASICLGLSDKGWTGRDLP
jgi:hypothetical protein